MTGFSQSALLQALGWATLNSFWQAGLLWCGFVVLRRWLLLSGRHQYRLAVGSLLLTLLSFCGSFGLYQSGFFQVAGPVSLASFAGSHWFHHILTAASITYLLLLAVPASRLFHNWRFLRRLRRSQFTKAPAHHRMYVQKIAWHLGIRQPVKVYLSALVQSPVTIGYLKPLVLLPVAGFNQLTLQQAEAILLHELAHIRRCDFVVNIAISVIHTLLYFNPFVRLFVRVAENSRETCCDELVLQFGYDPMAYAGALVQLEKNSAPLPKMALAATGKNNLLTRIETIVGIPAALPGLRWRHFTGLLASVLVVLALHSLFINTPVPDAKRLAETFTELANPFAMALPAEEYQAKPVTASHRTIHSTRSLKTLAEPATASEALEEPVPQPEAPGAPLSFVQVAQVADPMTTLEAAEQAQVQQTVAATRQVLTQLQWEAMEQNMTDALNAAEKAAVQRQYQKDLEAINWKMMEANLASRYHQTNWTALNQYLGSAAYKMHLDSISASCNEALAETDKLLHEKNTLLLPDHSEAAVRQARTQLLHLRDSLESLRRKPVIKL